MAGFRVVGAVLTVLTLIDVFLAIYARLGTSIFSSRLGRNTWRVFGFIADLFLGPQKTLLAFGGPVILMVNVLFWAPALCVGRAVPPRRGNRNDRRRAGRRRGVC
jgi:hypothetical protein